MLANIFSNLQSTGVFFLFLGILITVHEWGHFITAKKLGVRVDEFALGFGPTLFSKPWNGTNYILKLLPLGGYVKMAGDERSKCTGKPDEFYSKSPWKRALVVFNGPLVNFVFAYLSFIFVFMLGYPGSPTKVTKVIENGPAYEAGLEAGDEIVAINGYKVYGWMNMENFLEGSQKELLDVIVLREGEEKTLSVMPNIVSKPNLLGRTHEVRDLGITAIPNKIGGLVKGFPAQKAGLKAGDVITEIDGTKIYDWTLLQKTIAESKNERIIIKVMRDDAEHVMVVTPKITERKDKEGNVIEIRQIGIGPAQDFQYFKFDFLTSCRKAYEELYYITVLTYESLFRMVTGAMSAKQSVTGPVGIFYIVKGASEAGLPHILFILGVISASLAIFNLLPVIPLDGGHLFLLGLEKIRGRALPEKVDEYIARAGFGLIILLAVFVFYADFSRFGWINKILQLFGQ
ncbi:Membrane-associated zinc metalloprotease [hydrothermal vent metagenome]|uniref:Membrane-associated zinc metalloprotease n=1 Tax=hydrothermal vent metagenome TaxID=652676 RepID=A0A3B1CWM9_9ZZZZ